MKKQPIFVTQPVMPDLDRFVVELEKIWQTKILTNGGPLHQKFEEELCEYLEVEYISLFSNATIALITALKVLGLSGEIITTPYSFVATANAITWNNIKPVFVDVDPVTFNIDPSRIVEAITSKTTAILPVHCYGIPCNVEEIDRIAKNYDLKVVYDAAHAFGVKCHCGSLLTHGDLSVVSFHATKVFNTFEGGAIVSKDYSTKLLIDKFKNFGFEDEVTVGSAGINGKMSEINAAFGSLQLQNIDRVIERRQQIYKSYHDAFRKVVGITCIDYSGVLRANYSYFMIMIDSDYTCSRDELYNKLKNHGIYARRYFYPLITEFPMYSGLPSAAKCNLPVANEIAEKVLCLPIYPDLSHEDQMRVISIIDGSTE